MTQIATAAGFNSVRQMNRVMHDVFQFTPSELREKRRQPDRLVVDGGLELRVPYRPPLGLACSSRVPRAAGNPRRRSRGPRRGRVPAHDRCRRCARRDRGVGRAREQALHLRAHLPSIDGLVHLVAGVRRLFDLDADPKAIDRHLARDPRLRPLVRARKGLRVPGALDPFELGVRAILGQQVSVARATALSGALVEQLGRPVPRDRARSA